MHLLKQGRAEHRRLISGLKSKLRGGRPDITSHVRAKVRKARKARRARKAATTLIAHAPFRDPHAELDDGAAATAAAAAAAASDSDGASVSSIDSEERERRRLKNVKRGLSLWYDTHDYRDRPKTPPPRSVRARHAYCLESLTDINLSQNRLVTLPSWMSGVTSLRRLDLTWNVLESVPTAVGGFPALVELRLCRNSMSFHGMMQVRQWLG